MGKRSRLPSTTAVLLVTVLALAANAPTARAQFGWFAPKSAIQEQKANGGDDDGNPLLEIVQGNAVFAGKIAPALSNLVLTKEKLAKVWAAVDKVVDFNDMIIIAALGWGIVPATALLYERFIAPGPAKMEESADAARDNELGVTPPEKIDLPRILPRISKHFGRSILGRIVNSLSQLAKIAVGVYVLDIMEVVLANLGVSFRGLDRMSEAFAKCAYTVWGARRLQNIKKILIAKAVKKHPDSVGRALILDHLVDAVLIGVTAFFLVDILSVEMGLAIKSIFAFGSAGTLVLSLASKDIASQVVNGLALSASDKIYEGETVRFGDGTIGTVTDLGFMETTLRLEDELTVAIPNSQLANQRIVNFSRATKSQVKQTLRFKDADAEKLPKVLEDIETEIHLSCPSLIEDGTRAFRAHWTDYKGPHLEVVVDAHFDIRPIGKEYWDNREKMLHAIDRAVKKNAMQLA